jgi:hypothetical protein
MVSKSKAMFEGLDAETAFEMFSPTDNKYRIVWECGSAEAARRQKVAGVGEVTPEGYARKTASDYFAELAEADEDASVEVLE